MHFSNHVSLSSVNNLTGLRKDVKGNSSGRGKRDVGDIIMMRQQIKLMLVCCGKLASFFKVDNSERYIT